MWNVIFDITVSIFNVKNVLFSVSVISAVKMSFLVLEISYFMKLSLFRLCASYDVGGKRYILEISGNAYHKKIYMYIFSRSD